MIATIINKLIKSLNPDARKINDIDDWDLQFIYDAGFDGEDLNLFTVKLSNHEKEKTYRIQYCFCDDEHITYWYNFDDIYKTKNIDDVVLHLKNWLLRLMQK